jgi:hypothetical protein
MHINIHIYLGSVIFILASNCEDGRRMKLSWDHVQWLNLVIKRQYLLVFRLKHVYDYDVRFCSLCVCSGLRTDANIRKKNHAQHVLELQQCSWRQLISKQRHVCLHSKCVYRLFGFRVLRYSPILYTVFLWRLSSTPSQRYSTWTYFRSCRKAGNCVKHAGCCSEEAIT